jgi:CubicO group peptidase (beta-lactamase class C family)
MFSTQDIKTIHNMIDTFPVSSQVAIAKVDGDAVEYYGAIKENTHIKTIHNENAIFEIGSITKLFTSSLLAQSLLDKRINLDEPVHEKLGFALKNNANITYKELAIHTSGLPSIPFSLLLRIFFGSKKNPYRDYDENTLLDDLQNNINLKKKGVLRYSNLGAGLLGYTLSKIAEKNYEDLLQQQLFTPLNMPSTTTNREHIKDKLVLGLDKKGNVTNNWDLNVLAGAGAVLSSTHDLSKFLIANNKNELDYLRLQRQCIYRKGKNSMGLGWFILKSHIPNIDEVYFHNGGTGGYRSSMVLNMEKGQGIVILSNISALYLFKSSKVDNLAFSLLEHFT